MIAVKIAKYFAHLSPASLIVNNIDMTYEPFRKLSDTSYIGWLGKLSYKLLSSYKPQKIYFFRIFPRGRPWSWRVRLDSR